jgi:hypothetical protein
MSEKILPVDVYAVTQGQTLFCSGDNNADGTPTRARVNGKLRTWKRQPGYFELPMKHGLRDCFYITPNNASYWFVSEADAVAARLLYRAPLGGGGLMYSSRDLALEAFEDGHSHVIYD